MKNVVFQKVELNNFKCHEEMEFDFGENKFFMITGPNGSGKTTIFDALCWALYDYTTKGRTGDAVLRKRDPKDCCVKLKFKVDDDTYEIHNYRKHKKYGNNKFLFKNNEELTGATRLETNKIIENVLVPFDVFRNCLLFSQYITKSFTELPDSGKKDILDKMLLLEKYDEYKSKVSEKCYLIEKEITRIQKEIPILEEKKKYICNSLEREKAQIREQITELNEEKEKSEDKIYKLKQTFDSYEEKLKEIPESLDQELSDKQVELASLKSKLNELKEAESSEINILREQCTMEFQLISKDITSEFRDKENEIKIEVNECNRELQDLIEKQNYEVSKINHESDQSLSKIREQYLQEIGEINKSVHGLEGEISSSNKLLENLKKKLSDSNSLIQKLHRSITEEESRCYACGQPIDLEIKRKFRIQMEQEEENRTKVSEEIKSIEESIQKYREDLENHRTTLKEKEESFKLVKERFEKEKEEKIQKILESTEEIRNQLKQKSLFLNKKLDSLTQEKEEKLQKAKESIRSKGQEKANIIKSKFEEERKELEIKINSIQEKIDILKQMVLSSNELRSKAEITAGQIKLLQDSVEEISKKIKHLMEKDIDSEYQEKIREVDQEITKFSNDVSILNEKLEIGRFWIKAFSDQGIKSIIMDEAIPIMNAKAKELSSLTETIRVSFDSQKTLKSGDSRNKFSVNVIQTKNLTDDRNDFSGGEGKLVDIITLMCLRELLEKMYEMRFNIFLFDEILDALDSDNSLIVVNMLKKLSEEKCVILISHTLRDIIDADVHLQM